MRTRANTKKFFKKMARRENRRAAKAAIRHYADDRRNAALKRAPYLDNWVLH